MTKNKILLILLTAVLFGFDSGDLFAQAAPASSDGVIRLNAITIKARVRRPTIVLSPTRIKPIFNLESNNIESMSDQIKERPKSDFYIRKDSMVPSELNVEKMIFRERN